MATAEQAGFDVRMETAEQAGAEVGGGLMHSLSAQSLREKPPTSKSEVGSELGQFFFSQTVSLKSSPTPAPTPPHPIMHLFSVCVSSNLCLTV